jgi:hypothetical protein
MRCKWLSAMDSTSTRRTSSGHCRGGEGRLNKRQAGCFKQRGRVARARGPKEERTKHQRQTLGTHQRGEHTCHQCTARRGAAPRTVWSGWPVEAEEPPPGPRKEGCGERRSSYHPHNESRTRAVTHAHVCTKRQCSSGSGGFGERQRERHQGQQLLPRRETGQQRASSGGGGGGRMYPLHIHGRAS